MGIKPDKEEEKSVGKIKGDSKLDRNKERGQFFYNVTPTQRQRQREKHTPSSVLHYILLGSPWRRNERLAIFFF